MYVAKSKNKMILKDLTFVHALEEVTLYLLLI